MRPSQASIMGTAGPEIACQSCHACFDIKTHPFVQGPGLVVALSSASCMCCYTRQDMPVTLAAGGPQLPSRAALAVPSLSVPSRMLQYIRNLRASRSHHTGGTSPFPPPRPPRRPAWRAEPRLGIAFPVSRPLRGKFISPPNDPAPCASSALKPSPSWRTDDHKLSAAEVQSRSLVRCSVSSAPVST